VTADVADGDRELATFTTEELVAVGFPGVAADDDPWLVGLSPSARAAALGAGLRGLVARGMLRPADGRAEAVGALGEIGRLCARASVRVEATGRAVRHTLHGVRSGLVVHHGAASGAHRFVLRTEERAAREVVGALGASAGGAVGALDLVARRVADGRAWQAAARLVATADGVVLTTKDETRAVPPAEAWTVVAGLLLPPDTR
jgi:hypothetical protein